MDAIDMEIKQKMSKKMKKELIELMKDYGDVKTALLNLHYDIINFCSKKKAHFRITFNHYNKTASFEGEEAKIDMKYDEKTPMSANELYKIFFNRKDFIYIALKDTKIELEFLLNMINDFLSRYEKELTENQVKEKIKNDQRI